MNTLKHVLFRLGQELKSIYKHRNESERQFIYLFAVHNRMIFLF